MFKTYLQHYKLKKNRLYINFIANIIWHCKKACSLRASNAVVSLKKL